MSDQRQYHKDRYQQAKAAGVCVRCRFTDAIPGKVMCAACAPKLKQCKHCYTRPPRGYWAGVDWSKSNEQLAKEAGVTPSAAYLQRKKS